MGLEARAAGHGGGADVAADVAAYVVADVRHGDVGLLAALWVRRPRRAVGIPLGSRHGRHAGVPVGLGEVQAPGGALVGRPVLLLLLLLGAVVLGRTGRLVSGRCTVVAGVPGRGLWVCALPLSIGHEAP